MQQTPMLDFVNAILAHAQLTQLDPRHKHFDVGRGHRGVLHIVTQHVFRDGRLVRQAERTLCRDTTVKELGLFEHHIAPTCRRCQETAERIILRRTHKK